MIRKPTDPIEPHIPLKPNGFMLVGEAPGADEAVDGHPFVGASGKLLDEVMRFAGLVREDCYITNVFMTRPPRNDLSHFFSKDKVHSQNPRHTNLGYLKSEHLPELTRLKQEIEGVNPKIIIALGGCALWALTGLHKISDYRGVSLLANTGHKLIATFHPAAAMREYSYKPIIAMDLQKAAREAISTKPLRVRRKVHIIQSAADMDVAVAACLASGEAGVDVETERKCSQITCLSLAPSPKETYVIPIWDYSLPDYSYFNAETELEILAKLAVVLHNPAIKKVFQNATYDLTYLENSGLKPEGIIDDTMLMMHSWQPEWPKSLGFMGSIFTDETAWKVYRVAAAKDSNKNDE